MWKSARNREEARSKDKRGLYLFARSPQTPEAEFSEWAEFLRKGKVKVQREGSTAGDLRREAVGTRGSGGLER